MPDELESNLQNPKRVRGDSSEVEQHDLKDQIEADRYLAAKKASLAKRLAVRFFKLIAPGAE